MMTLIKSVDFIPNDTQEISAKFLANTIQEDLSQIEKVDIVHIRFTPNSLEVFTPEMYKLTYQL